MTVERKAILDYLKSRAEMLKCMDLMGPEGQIDKRKSEKMREVAGFAEIIIRHLRNFPVKEHKDTLTLLECSCGKSYLGFALSFLIPEFCSRQVQLIGVDFNEELIRRCADTADRLELGEACFVCSRIIDYVPQGRIDIAVSLHACDTATDEAIVQGIRSGAGFIHVVPCCQNQIRGQIKVGHPLEPLTAYGPARYRMANLLTDVLRAEFIKAAGYHVELDEIGSPKLTPKNLCISARRVKRKSKGPRHGGYRELRDIFGVKTALEKLCPEVITENRNDGE